MGKTGKKAGIFCMISMLAMTAPFKVWAQDQTDVETLERQAQNMKTASAELPYIGLYNEAHEEGFSSFRNEEVESVEFGRGASITKERVYQLAEYLRQ